MRNVWWIFVGSIALLLVAVFIDLPGTETFFGKNVQVRKGIDLAGGARLLMCSKVPNPSQTDMGTARTIMQQRAAGGFGVTEPQVAQVGKNCISVEMPGLKNQTELRNTIGKTGFLALTDSSTRSFSPDTKVKLVCASQDYCPRGLKVGTTNINASPPVMQIIAQGKDVKPGSAQVGFDQTTGQPVVNYTLQGTGSDKWCNYTTNNVGKYSAIVLDNRVRSDPVINGAICGGQTQISGVTQAEANEISTFLNYGALPIAFKVDSSERVEASLGPQ